MVAGLCFSIALLHAMLITPCDTLVRNMGNLQGVVGGVTKYVDDLTITLKGTVRSVSEAVWTAFDEVKDEFGSLGWSLSLNMEATAGKTVVLATNAALREELQGVRVVKHARGLGVDVASGRRPGGCKMVQAKRVKAVRARKVKLRWAKRGGGATRKVGRGGITPQAAYGASCVAVTPTERDKIRGVVNMTEAGKTHSCSRTLRLAVGGLDPVHDMVAAPFFKWAVSYTHLTLPTILLV